MARRCWITRWRFLRRRCAALRAPGVGRVRLILGLRSLSLPPRWRIGALRHRNADLAASRPCPIEKRGGRVTTALRAPRGTDQDTLTQLINQWAAKRSRNVLRSVYYDGKNALIDFGISLPPSMRNIDVVLGWPAKAVHALVARCNFDGFVLPGENEDPFDLLGLLTDANADAILPQAFTSAATHSVSFLTITPGAS